jgi:hypothetical protein
MGPLPHHQEKDNKENLNKEGETSYRQETVVHHASKSQRPPEADQADGFAG